MHDKSLGDPSSPTRGRQHSPQRAADGYKKQIQVARVECLSTAAATDRLTNLSATPG